ncbi:MAG: lycopene cyclase domain-containing protein [Salinirussus sp.]
MTLTYAAFHALFTVPPVLGLGVLVGRRSDRSEVRPIAVAIIVGLALAWTIPWDNYLIARGVWDYGTGRVLGVIWRAPIEEYVFIAIQPVLTALWLSAITTGDTPTVQWQPRDAAIGLLMGGALGIAGLVGVRYTPTFYLGAIVAWASPVLALQWAVGWRYLVARVRPLILGVTVPTLYLSTADALAIASGIWQLSPNLTTGLTVVGLPIEEGCFFLLTNLLVVQGLLLYPWVTKRLG